MNATGADLADPATVRILGMDAFRQSTLLGFIGFVTMAFLLLAPLVWILKRTTVPTRLGRFSSVMRLAACIRLLRKSWVSSS